MIHNDNISYQKYMKYKQKYLYFKKQNILNGGGTNINVNTVNDDKLLNKSNLFDLTKIIQDLSNELSPTSNNIQNVLNNISHELKQQYNEDKLQQSQPLVNTENKIQTSQPLVNTSNQMLTSQPLVNTGNQMVRSQPLVNTRNKIQMSQLLNTGNQMVTSQPLVNTGNQMLTSQPLVNTGNVETNISNNQMSKPYNIYNIQQLHSMRNFYKSQQNMKNKNIRLSDEKMQVQYPMHKNKLNLNPNMILNAQRSVNKSDVTRGKHRVIRSILELK